MAFPNDVHPPAGGASPPAQNNSTVYLFVTDHSCLQDDTVADQLDYVYLVDVGRGNCSARRLRRNKEGTKNPNYDPNVPKREAEHDKYITTNLKKSGLEIWRRLHRNNDPKTYNTVDG